jgi:hypothetical protein
LQNLLNKERSTNKDVVDAEVIENEKREWYTRL